MERKINLIMGKRGEGKSTLTKSLIKNSKRLIVFDTLGYDYTGCGVCIENFQELSEFWTKHHNKNFRIIYQPLNMHAEFPIIADLVYECGNLDFVVEEVDTFLSINQQGLHPAVLNIIQRGRHKNIEFYGITQRPYSLPAILRSQCKILYSFRQTEPRDIEWLRSVMGDDAFLVKELKQYNYSRWENGKTVIRETTK